MSVSTCCIYNSYLPSATVLYQNYYNVVCCKCPIDLGTCRTVSQRDGTAQRHRSLLDSHQDTHHTIAIKFIKHWTIAILLIQYHSRYWSMQSPRSTIARIIHLSQDNHAVKGCSALKYSFMITKISYPYCALNLLAL